MSGTIVTELIHREHCFEISLDFDGYSRLARIRNARFNNDIEALASVVERGLIEMEGDIVTEGTESEQENRND